MKLHTLLQLGYSAEMAAAFAYRGHAGSVGKSDEKRDIQKIELEEWEHRENLYRMMCRLSIKPSRWLEIKYYVIGRIIGLSCYVIGRFMPMYFAGRLESGNVNEYILLEKLVMGTELEVEIPCIRKMAIVEKEHEMYFLSKSKDHFLIGLFSGIFGWGPGKSYNTIDLNKIKAT